jgi:hypothetical protein
MLSPERRSEIQRDAADKRRSRNPAKGHTRFVRGKTRIVISVDPALFETISQAAQAAGVSWGTMATRLLSAAVKIKITEIPNGKNYTVDLYGGHSGVRGRG